MDQGVIGCHGVVRPGLYVGTRGFGSVPVSIFSCVYSALV